MSVLSVCIRNCICEQQKYREKVVHRVISETIGQMLGPCIADIIATQVECGECLYEKVPM